MAVRLLARLAHHRRDDGLRLLEAGSIFKPCSAALAIHEGVRARPRVRRKYFRFPAGPFTRSGHCHTSLFPRRPIPSRHTRTASGRSSRTPVYACTGAGVHLSLDWLRRPFAICHRMRNRAGVAGERRCLLSRRASLRGPSPRDASRTEGARNYGISTENQVRCTIVLVDI